MAFAKSTLTQRQAVRDAVIALDKATTLAHDTGPLDTLGPGVDAAGAKVVAALNSAGAAAGGTATVVTNGQVVKGVTPSGEYTNSVTFTVSDGAITAIVLS